MRPLNDNNARHLLDLLLNAADPNLSQSDRLAQLDELADWADGMRDALTAAREYHREVSNRRSDGVAPLPQSDAAKTAALLDVLGVVDMTYHRDAELQRVDEDSDDVEHCPASGSDVVDALLQWEAQHADVLAAAKNKS